jgi:hypothetical protein
MNTELSTSCLFGLFFEPDNGSHTFLYDIGRLSENCTALEESSLLGCGTV